MPAALSARTGAWCFDTMTVVGEGTWEAARAAVDTALTAADLVLGGATSGVRVLPPPWPPRDALGLRRFLLPEQRSDRRAAPP